MEYIDDTKLESKANKYTFVWRKTVERNRARLMDKIRTLPEQVDEAIVQENSVKVLRERNSYSKTDHDATSAYERRCHEEWTDQPRYNLQIDTENQFITDFGFFPNPTDTLTLIPFFTSFLHWKISSN